jgi:glutaredoxin
MMKTLLLLIWMAVVLLAGGEYPRLFSRLGTPLYEADSVLSGTSFTGILKDKTALYHIEAEKILQLGRDIENSELPEMETIRFYHTSLRMLDKKYNEILNLLRHELQAAIEKDDYALFMQIVDLHFDALFEQESVKRLVTEYYKKRRGTKKDPYLEDMANDLKQMEKETAASPASSGDTAAYNNKLIVLTASWCPVCREAKEYMKKHGIAFQEYDIERSSYGKKLYKEHGGFAVPMLIIGDKHKTGFDPAWIKKNLHRPALK